MKKCFKCNEIKKLENFYKHAGMSDGLLNKCKECTKKDTINRFWVKREQIREYDQYRHRYSVTRIFNHRYSSLRSRCTKIHVTNGIKKSVYGKKFLTKKEWTRWCYESDTYAKFIQIYNDWVQSNFERKLAPSIDRVDSKKGYIIGNLQWLTQSQNSQKSNK